MNLVRFHQSISHAHASGKISLGFMSANLVKWNLCEKFTVEDSGLQRVKELLAKKFRTRFIWNSCRFSREHFNWFLPSGNFHEHYSSHWNCCDLCFLAIFILLTRIEKFNVKTFSPHTICQLFWFVECVCEFSCLIFEWFCGTLTSFLREVARRESRGVRPGTRQI